MTELRSWVKFVPRDGKRTNENIGVVEPRPAKTFCDHVRKPTPKKAEVVKKDDPKVGPAGEYLLFDKGQPIDPADEKPRYILSPDTSIINPKEPQSTHIFVGSSLPPEPVLNPDLNTSLLYENVTGHGNYKNA